MQQVINTTREQLVQLIATQATNRIFSVLFVKKDGSKRKMVCRFGVTSKLKGGKSTLDASKFFTLYDMQAHDYRAVNKETILEAHLNHKIFKCEGNSCQH